MIYDDLSRESLIEELIRLSEESQYWKQRYEELRAFFGPVLDLVDSEDDEYTSDDCVVVFGKETDI